MFLFKSDNCLYYTFNCKNFITQCWYKFFLYVFRYFVISFERSMDFICLVNWSQNIITTISVAANRISFSPVMCRFLHWDIRWVAKLSNNGFGLFERFLLIGKTGLLSYRLLIVSECILSLLGLIELPSKSLNE